MKPKLSIEKLRAEAKLFCLTESKIKNNINKQNENVENNENLNKSGKKLKNELIIDSKVNLTKKINVNKNSKLIKKKISYSKASK